MRDGLTHPLVTQGFVVRVETDQAREHLGHLDHILGDHRVGFILRIIHRTHDGGVQLLGFESQVAGSRLAHDFVYHFIQIGLAFYVKISKLFHHHFGSLDPLDKFKRAATYRVGGEGIPQPLHFLFRQYVGTRQPEIELRVHRNVQCHCEREIVDFLETGHRCRFSIHDVLAPLDRFNLV